MARQVLAPAPCGRMGACERARPEENRYIWGTGPPARQATARSSERTRRGPAEGGAQAVAWLARAQVASEMAQRSACKGEGIK